MTPLNNSSILRPPGNLMGYGLTFYYAWRYFYEVKVSFLDDFSLLSG